MYGYSSNLNKDEILKRVPQEDIWEFILGYVPQEHQYITSPFRHDKRAGAFFEWYDGKLWLKDFANAERTHYDCFNAVEAMYGVNYRKALDIINTYFELGLDTNHPKPVIPVNNKAKKRATLTFCSRNFSVFDKNFWQPYGISRDNLVDDGVFAVRFYTSLKDDKFRTYRPQDICYCLTEFSPRLKIYRPHVRNKRLKWMTNCSKNDVGGMNVLPETGKKLFITSSYKDWRVLTNEGLTVVWFQSENAFPDSDILHLLADRFDEVFTIFDNDKPGIESAKKLANIIPSQVIILPESGGKDPSDLKKNNPSMFKNFVLSL